MKKISTLLLLTCAISASFGQVMCPGGTPTVSPANTSVTCSGNVTVDVANSENGVNYYLRRDSDNAIVRGPLAGTGSSISFLFNSSTLSNTYNVYAVANGNFAVNLPSGNDHVRFSSPFSGYTNEITVEAWVNFNNNEYPWAGQSDAGNDFMSRNIWLWHAGTFYVNDGGSWLALPFPGSIPTGWVHVATVANSTGMFIYYDGMLVASNSDGIINGIQNYAGSVVDLGHDPRFVSGTVGRNTNTAFDDFRIWNVTRTENEISSNMNTCLSGIETGLVQYTLFNEGIGTSISSVTGSAGTLMNPSSNNWINGAGLELATKSMVTVNSIADQTVSPMNTDVTCSGNAVISVDGTETGINYFLRNDLDNSIVAGPLPGTGSAVTFNTGNVSSATTFNVYAEKPSTALSFDGTNDKVLVMNNPSLQVGSGTDFTLEANIQFTASQGNYTGIFAKGNGGPFYQLVLVNNQLAAEINDGGSMIGVGDGLIGSTVLNDGKWHNVAMVVDRAATNVKLYVDGVVEADITNALLGNNLDNSDDMIIGAERGSNVYFGGKMDEVRIWNTARSASDLIDNRSACLSGAEAGLVAYYNFEDGIASAMLTDLAGGDNNGSLVNFDIINAWTTGVVNCGCTTEMTAMPTVTVNPIAQQTASPASSSVICAGSTNLTIGTEAGVNYYLRNDADDAIVAGPVSGNGSTITFNTGIISSTSTYNVYAVKPSTALGFDGTDDYVVASNPDLPAGNSDYTIEAWVKPDTYGNRGIAGWGNYGAGNQVNAFRLGGTDQLVNYWWGADLSVTVPGLNDGQWHHVAVTYDGSTRKIIVDGVVKGSDNPTGHNVTTTNNFTIGSTLNNSEVFNGGMDEVRIWNVARSEAELSGAMNTCLSGTEAGLVAYYNFEDGTGRSTLSDVVNGNNGTLVNMALSTCWTTGVANCGCAMEMTALANVAVNSIADQSLTAGQASFCDNGTTTIELASSEPTVTYYLRNDLNDTIIAGPVSGSGGVLSFNTGTISATTTYNVLAERIQPTNNALNFNGSGQYVSVPAGIDLANKSFTVEFWAKRNSGGTNFIMGQGLTGSTNESLHIGFRDNDVFTFAFYGNDIDVNSPASSDGNYHHWTCVYNSGQAGTDRFVYIDGNLAGSDDASSDFQGTGELRIGVHMFSGDYFNGELDEIRIWDRALDQTEIQSGMTHCLSGTESGLIAYYNVNVVSTTLVDNSGNGHDGTYVNMDPSMDLVNGIAATTCTYCELEMSQTPTVTINNSSSSTITEVACGSYTAPDGAVYTSSGIETAIISNATGCDSTITINLTVNNVDATITDNGSMLTANSSTAAYAWLNCDSQLLISGETAQSYSPTAGGNYAAVVTENGCVDTSACVNFSGVGITETTASNGWIVYPNPTSGAVTLTSSSDFNDAIISIVTIDGKEVIVKGNVSGKNRSFDMTDLAPGIYFMKIVQKENVSRIKIVKE